MTAQYQHEQFLPKEPTDLPREPLDLPKEPIDLPLQDLPPTPHYEEHHQSNRSIETLLTWKAPGRPFRKRGKEYYLTSLLVTTLIEIIAFLFGQYMLMLLIASFVFLVFVLATIPPHDFTYRLSTEGISMEDHFYLWQELYDFYFKKKEGVETLHVRTQAFLPGELIIPLGHADKEHIKNILLQVLPYREIMKPTFMEKSADWLAKTFPLEKRPSSV